MSHSQTGTGCVPDVLQRVGDDQDLRVLRQQGPGAEGEAAVEGRVVQAPDALEPLLAALNDADGRHAHLENLAQLHGRGWDQTCLTRMAVALLLFKTTASSLPFSPRLLAVRNDYQGGDVVESRHWLVLDAQAADHLPPFILIRRHWGGQV